MYHLLHTVASVTKAIVNLIENEKGKRFGYYLNTPLVPYEEDFRRQQTDHKTFHFVLESADRRYPRPVKFEIKNVDDGGCKLFSVDDWSLILIGNIDIKKYEHKSSSATSPKTYTFDYHGIAESMNNTRNEGNTNVNYFTPKSFVVLQFE